jgi:PadR family transcriptional regulator, regulatory protein AphA
MIEYAILGLLSWKPLSGYDLKKIMSDSSLFYWSGNNNQIYHSLLQLYHDGLVSQQVQYQDTLPAKKIYSLTETGHSRLRQWLLSPPELPELHNIFLIQLCWADVLAPQELDDFFARYEDELETQICIEKEKVRRADWMKGSTPRGSFLRDQVSAHVCQTYQNELEWVRQMRVEILKRGF